MLRVAPAPLPLMGVTGPTDGGVAATMVVLSPVLAVAAPPPDTLAWLVSGEEAFAATLAVTVMAGYLADGASTSLRLQIGNCEQSHPVPDITVTVSPAGAVSVTITCPLVGAAPILLTITV